MKKYRVQARETEDSIEDYDTEQEAIEAVEAYESEDVSHCINERGMTEDEAKKAVAKSNFYEIVEID